MQKFYFGERGKIESLNTYYLSRRKFSYSCVSVCTLQAIVTTHLTVLSRSYFMTVIDGVMADVVILFA